MKRAVVLVATALLVAACGTTTKYAMPNVPQPAAPPQSCIATCERGRTFALRKKDREMTYDFECLSHCPGIVVSESECEEHEKPPHGFCVEKYETYILAQAVGGAIVLALLLVTVVAAVEK